MNCADGHQQSRLSNIGIGAASTTALNISRAEAKRLKELSHFYELQAAELQRQIESFTIWPSKKDSTYLKDDKDELEKETQRINEVRGYMLEGWGFGTDETSEEDNDDDYNESVDIFLPWQQGHDKSDLQNTANDVPNTETSTQLDRTEHAKRRNTFPQWAHQLRSSLQQVAQGSISMNKEQCTSKESRRASFFMSTVCQTSQTLTAQQAESKLMDQLSEIQESQKVEASNLESAINFHDDQISVLEQVLRACNAELATLQTEHEISQNQMLETTRPMDREQEELQGLLAQLRSEEEQMDKNIAMLRETYEKRKNGSTPIHASEPMKDKEEPALRVKIETAECKQLQDSSHYGVISLMPSGAIEDISILTIDSSCQ